MKEVDNHDNQEQGATESDEVMEVEVDEEVKDAIEKRLSGVLEDTEQTADDKKDVEVSKDAAGEDAEVERDVTERELPDDNIELKEDETMASKSDEVGVVFDRDEERREMPPITVISTISLEGMKNEDRRDSTGRKVIEVTKEFHEISISDTETESELNTTNEEAGEEVMRRGEKEKVRMEEEEETDAGPTRQMAMPKVEV